MRGHIPYCHIGEMLRAQKRPHISFHTPGHKRAGADITELPYSDNLLSPCGVIARAEEDVARIAGAERAFLLTDGSTSGVHAMLLALREAGHYPRCLPRVFAQVRQGRVLSPGA